MLSFLNFFSGLALLAHAVQSVAIPNTADLSLLHRLFRREDVCTYGPGDYNHMDPYKAKGLNMFLISFRDPVQTYASNWGVDPCIFGGTNGFQLIKFKTCVRNASSNDRETPPDRAIDIIFVRNGCCQFFKNADCTEWVETVTDMVHPPKITTLAPQVTRNQIRSFRCTEEKQCLDMIM